MIGTDSDKIRYIYGKAKIKFDIFVKTIIFVMPERYNKKQYMLLS